MAQQRYALFCLCFRKNGIVTYKIVSFSCSLNNFLLKKCNCFHFGCFVLLFCFCFCFCFCFRFLFLFVFNLFIFLFFFQIFSHQEKTDNFRLHISYLHKNYILLTSRLLLPYHFWKKIWYMPPGPYFIKVKIILSLKFKINLIFYLIKEFMKQSCLNFFYEIVNKISIKVKKNWNLKNLPRLIDDQFFLNPDFKKILTFMK